MGMIIDTHAHIYLEEFRGDLDQVIERAKAIGVEAVYLPNIDSETVESLFDLCDRYPDFFYPMMGLHPVSVKENFEDEIRKIRQKTRNRKIFAVGEIGSDSYWDQSYLKEQEEAFFLQCDWSLEEDLPIVIHSRNTMDWQIEMVESYRGKLKGIFHCFSGTIEQARRITEMGFYLGIGGIVTFKNGGLDKILSEIPIEFIVLETDAPYLAPVPYRGKRNEPGYLKYIIKRISNIYDLPERDILQTTTENALKIFRR